MQKNQSLRFIANYLLVIVLLLVTVSCRRSSNPPTTQQKLIGKWTMKTAIGNYTVQGSNHKDTTTFTANDYFNFKADGTITIIENNNSHTGNWKVTNNKLIISNTNYIDYPSGFDMPVLTSTDLQLYYTETNSVSVTEQKLNLKK